ncbi:hypothetical protein L2E82_50681 [Cichorium intybus]|nr:hypothetical protein L2E82_50681 [Cichorium intybus]
MPLPCSATTTAATMLQSPSSISTTTAYTTIGSKIAYHKVVMCSCEPFSSIATSSPSTVLKQKGLYMWMSKSRMPSIKYLVNVGLTQLLKKCRKLLLADPSLYFKNFVE